MLNNFKAIGELSILRRADLLTIFAVESHLRRIFRARPSAPRSPSAATQTGRGAEEGLQRRAAIVDSSESVAASSRERNGLLREFHHRINNNMQLISSLLQLQANSIKDPVMLELFEEFAGRIRAMSLIHQKVDRNGALGRVNFKACLETLADTLLRAQSKGVKVRRRFDMEPVALGIDTAIPVGLIANEIISNLLKHAFAGRPEGLVRVSLNRSGADQFRLAIGDDGCGGAEDVWKAGCLGLRLVKVLTGQIRGQMEYKNENGAEFALVFKDTLSRST